MRARVKGNSPLSIVRACVGRDFTKDAWTELPDSFLKEVGGNPYLEIEQVKHAEPDEAVEPDAPGGQTASGVDVVLAGNAATVKKFVSTMQDTPSLEEMKQAESRGKARKGVLDAIDDRLAEVEGD